MWRGRSPSTRLTARSNKLKKELNILISRGRVLMKRYLDKQVTDRVLDKTLDRPLLYGCSLDKRKSELILEYTTVHKESVISKYRGYNIPADDPYATHTAMLRLRLLPTAEISVTAEIVRGKSVVFSKEVGTTMVIHSFHLFDYAEDKRFRDPRALMNALLDMKKWFAYDAPFKKAKKLVGEFEDLIRRVAK